MFTRLWTLWQRVRGWRPRGLGDEGALVVIVDLTEVLPIEVAARADLVVVPAHWDRRAELVVALAARGHVVLCVADGAVCDEVRAAVARARRAGGRVAVRRLSRACDATTV